LVIRYAYLWHSEYEQGLEEGGKNRPCAIILTAIDEDGETVVTVLPVTHTRPRTRDSQNTNGLAGLHGMTCAVSRG
jgi:hypothetical protein